MFQEGPCLVVAYFRTKTDCYHQLVAVQFVDKLVKKNGLHFVLQEESEQLKCYSRKLSLHRVVAQQYLLPPPRWVGNK